MNPNCPSASLRIESEKNILQLCSDLHYFCTSAYPDLDNPEKIYSDIKFAINTWKDGLDRYKGFDDAVLFLLKKTAEEYEKFILLKS
jgi:hypothetical protein